MAIWQCRLALLPRQGVLDEHGTIPESIEDRFVDVEGLDPGSIFDDTIYWSEFDTVTMGSDFGDLLPEMSSWSDETLMYGSKEGDRIEVWPKSINVRIDCRDLNFEYLKRLCESALSQKLLFLDLRTLAMIEPEFFQLVRQLRNSLAHRFVKNPVEALEENAGSRR